MSSGLQAVGLLITIPVSPWISMRPRLLMNSATPSQSLFTVNIKTRIKMGFNIGSIVNSTANIASRKSDGGKAKESSLYEFYNAIANGGVQIKSNFEVEFL